MVTSEFAMRTAMRKAGVAGIGYVGVWNSCHFGAAGYYAQLAARQDMIGVAMANDIPSVNAPGARGAITGSNPLAYAVPKATGGPILLDMATSIVAGGKVAAAQCAGPVGPRGLGARSRRPTQHRPGRVYRGGLPAADGRPQRLWHRPIDRDPRRFAQRRRHALGNPGVDAERSDAGHASWRRVPGLRRGGLHARRRIQTARGRPGRRHPHRARAPATIGSTCLAKSSGSGASRAWPRGSCSLPTWRGAWPSWQPSWNCRCLAGRNPNNRITSHHDAADRPGRNHPAHPDAHRRRRPGRRTGALRVGAADDRRRRARVVRRRDGRRRAAAGRGASGAG